MTNTQRPSLLAAHSSPTAEVVVTYAVAVPVLHHQRAAGLRFGDEIGERLPHLGVRGALALGADPLTPTTSSKP